MNSDIKVICTGRGRHGERTLSFLRDGRIKSVPKLIADYQYLAKFRARPEGVSFDPGEADTWTANTVFRRLEMNGISYIDGGSRKTRSGRWMDHRNKPSTHVVEDASGLRTFIFNCPTCDFPVPLPAALAEKLFDDAPGVDFDISRL